MATYEQGKAWIESLPLDQQAIVKRATALTLAKNRMRSDLANTDNKARQRASKQAYVALGGDAAHAAAQAELKANPQLYQQYQNMGVKTGGLGQGAPILAALAAIAGGVSAFGGGAGAAASPGATGMGSFTADQLASPILAGGAGSGQGLSLATLGGAAPAASAIPGMVSAAPSVAVPSTAGATIPAAGGAASAIPSFGGLSSNTLGSLASGAASLYGAQQGVNAAQDATGELRRQFDIGQANAKPWLEAGKSALGAQQELMGLGGQSPEQQLASLVNSPGYKFRFDQGQQARERSAAARGMLNSGNVLAGLTEYGQNFASNEYGNRLNQLAGLSGTGQTQANANMNAGMNYAGEMGNASLAAGNARMSGALGVGNALSNIFNPPKEQPTFKMVNGQWSYV